MGYHRDALADAVATGDSVPLDGLIIASDGDGGFRFEVLDAAFSGLTEDGPHGAPDDCDDHATNRHFWSEAAGESSL